MKALRHLVDASEHFQGSYVCLNAVEKLVSQPRRGEFIEVPSIPQILLRGFK